VWLAAGETVLESADVRDRRVANQAASDLGGFSLSASGYTDESSNRSLDTEYTNTTEKPLDVRVTLEVSAANDRSVAIIEVDESTIERPVLDSTESDINAGTTLVLSAIVPSGSTYTVFGFSDVDTIQHWNEQTFDVV